MRIRMGWGCGVARNRAPVWWGVIGGFERIGRYVFWKDPRRAGFRRECR